MKTKNSPEQSFRGVQKWRRRRDSNPRDPFGAYTISNRARSTKLRDFSVFALRFVVLFCFCVARAGQATMGIIAGFCQKSSPFLKKFKKVFPPSGKGKQRGGEREAEGRTRTGGTSVTGRNCDRRWCSNTSGCGRPRSTWW